MKRELVGIGTTLLLMLVALLFVPKVLGWRTATVDSDMAGTYYPQTVGNFPTATAPLLSCEQTSGTTVPTAQINITKSTTSTRSYFSCTNNWGSDVTFTITVANAGGTGISLSGASRTISPGQTKCISATITTPNTNGGDVLYAVAATATDLSATLQFAGSFRTPGTDSAQCSFP